MTLYDISLTQQETEETENGHFPMGLKPNVKLTVTVTPWLPIIVPPGSTLIINRDTGPDAHLTGPEVGLVTRGPEFYTNSRIIDGYVLEQLQLDAAQYLAHAGEDLIQESIRKIAVYKVEQL